MVRTRWLAVSLVDRDLSAKWIFHLNFNFQIFRRVMEVNSDARMRCVYRPHSIVTVSTIVPTKVTRRTVRQSHVPTINSYVRVADRMEPQNALQKRNCATANVTAKMAPMRRPHAVSAKIVWGLIRGF